MRDRVQRLVGLFSGAAIIGGTLMILFPGLGRFLIPAFLLGLSVAASVLALAVTAPGGSVTRLRFSPFESPTGGAEPRARSVDLDRIRAHFVKPRRPIPAGPALPLPVLVALRALIEQELEHMGLDPTDATDLIAARPLLSDAAWAVLTAPLAPGRFWTPHLWPNPSRVGEAVGSVLDEIDSIRARHAPIALNRTGTP